MNMLFTREAMRSRICLDEARETVSEARNPWCERGRGGSCTRAIRIDRDGRSDENGTDVIHGR